MADGLARSGSILLWLAGRFPQREVLQPEEGQHLCHVGVFCLASKLHFQRQGNISGMQGDSAGSAGRFFTEAEQQRISLIPTVLVGKEVFFVLFVF